MEKGKKEELVRIILITIIIIIRVPVVVVLKKGIKNHRLPKENQRGKIIIIKAVKKNDWIKNKKEN